MNKKIALSRKICRFIKILTFCIPVKTIRKKIRKHLENYFLSKNKDFQNIVKTIENKIESCNYCFATVSIYYQADLFQRPQHLFNNFSDKGILSIYIQDNIYDENIFIGDNLIVTNIAVFKNINKKYLNKMYFFLMSTVDAYSVKDILKLKSEGIKLIYEYIDEINDKISGKRTKTLLNIFNNLNVIEPVLLIASAKNLFNELKDKYPDKPLLLSNNAVDVSHFSNIDDNFYDERFMSIIKKNKPVIGYYGAMAAWLDWDLINKLAEKRSDLEFVFIGADYFNNLRKLELRGNISYLGPKSYHILQNYASKFDCCIIPFGDDTVAKSTSPLKLFEYMALKKPVVVTDNLIECFGYKGVYAANGVDDFSAKIDIALKENTKEMQECLYKQALENTWSKRADEIIKNIKMLIQ